MKIIYALLILTLLLSEVQCSNNNSSGNTSKTDTTHTSVTIPVISKSDSIKNLIIGVWAGKEHNERDTLQIGKDRIYDIGEDTRLKYTLQNDSIIIYGDSTTILEDKDKVYKAKIVVTKNTITLTDKEDTSVLTRIK
jgi:hypothetical protein